jgi:hypothetical protein
MAVVFYSWNISINVPHMIKPGIIGRGSYGEVRKG